MMSMELKESQFELFPGESKSYSPPTRQRYFWSNITLSFENILVASVVIVMLMVLSFSLGVERGKRIVRKSLRMEFLKARDAVVKEVESAMKVKMAVVFDHARQALIQAKEDSARQAALEAEAAALKEQLQKSLQQKTVSETPKAVPVSVPVQDLPLVISDDKENLKDLYTIQVASFKKEKLAQEEARQLKNKGFEIFVLPKGEHSIVCVGKFTEKDEASATMSKLRKRYKDCIVRSL